MYYLAHAGHTAVTLYSLNTVFEHLSFLWDSKHRYIALLSFIYVGTLQRPYCAGSDLIYILNLCCIHSLCGDVLVLQGVITATSLWNIYHNIRKLQHTNIQTWKVVGMYVSPKSISHRTRSGNGLLCCPTLHIYPCIGRSTGKVWSIMCRSLPTQ